MDQAILDKFDILTQDPDFTPTDFKVFADSLVATMRQELMVGDFDYSEKSLQLIDPIIDTLQSKLAENEEFFLTNVLRFGCFLGQAMVVLHNGQWVYNPEYQRWGVSVALANSDQAFFNVFNKMKNRILNGMDDSISYYYQLNKEILAS